MWEKFYRGGKEAGEWTRWNQQGQKRREGIIKDGKPVEKWVQLCESGQIWQQATYQDGLLITENRWDQNGNPL